MSFSRMLKIQQNKNTSQKSEKHEISFSKTHLCGTTLPDGFKLQSMGRQTTMSNITSGTEELHIPVLYVQLRTIDEKQIHADVLKKQHQYLVEDFLGVNQEKKDFFDTTDNDTKLDGYTYFKHPSFQKYDNQIYFETFKKTSGGWELYDLSAPNDDEIVLVDYILQDMEGEILTKDTFDGFLGVQDVRNTLPDVFQSSVSSPSVIVVVFTKLKNDIVLGEAFIRDNLLVIHHPYDESKVSLLGDQYDASKKHDTQQCYINFKGRTLTHEMGHCLGLPHTFEQSADCDWTNEPKNATLIEDIPFQKEPNKNEVTLYNKFGQIEPKGDHRQRKIDDKICNGFPKINGNQADNNYEMFFNFMDYSCDQAMAMFSPLQYEEMKLNVKQENFVCHASDKDTLQSKVQEITLFKEFLTGDAEENSPNLTVEPSQKKESSSSTILYLTIFLGIVLVMVVVALIVAGLRSSNKV